jgi:cytochrome P450
MHRTARMDTILKGKQIKKGDKVILYYGSANRDESIFDQPHQLLITRTPNKYLAFGGGHHICLG